MFILFQQFYHQKKEYKVKCLYKKPVKLSSLRKRKKKGLILWFEGSGGCHIWL